MQLLLVGGRLIRAHAGCLCAREMVSHLAIDLAMPWAFALALALLSAPRRFQVASKLFFQLWKPPKAVQEPFKRLSVAIK